MYLVEVLLEKVAKVVPTALDAAAVGIVIVLMSP